MSLVARHLESNGIATVIVGSARDIVLHCGVPRFVFSDIPLGNPSGRPFDREMQRAVVGAALDLLEEADAPRALRETPFRFAEGDADLVWRRRYLEITPERREELRRAGERRRAKRAGQHQKGLLRDD